MRTSIKSNNKTDLKGKFQIRQNDFENNRIIFDVFDEICAIMETYITIDDGTCHKSKSSRGFYPLSLIIWLILLINNS